MTNYHLDDKGNPMDSAWYREKALQTLKEGVDQHWTGTVATLINIAQVYATLAQAEALRELTEATKS